MSTLPFDRVVIDQEGTRTVLTASEFLGLALHARVRHILQREITFFDGSREIDRAEALRSLRMVRV
jgi:hypothetical protein